jgi:hypothetical protein
MTPLKCYKCGQFLGRDGYPDVFLVDGVYEEGYTMCGRCGRTEGYPDRRKVDDEHPRLSGVCVGRNLEPTR